MTYSNYDTMAVMQMQPTNFVDTLGCPNYIGVALLCSVERTDIMAIKYSGAT